jgi:hypothetical protein
MEPSSNTQYMGWAAAILLIGVGYQYSSINLVLKLQPPNQERNFREFKKFKN